MSATRYSFIAREGIVFLLLTALLLCGAASVYAQKIDPRAAGTTFVFAYPDTTKNLYDSRQDTDPRFTPREPRQDSMFIAIYSAAENELTLTGNGGYARTMKMTAGSFEIVFLNGNPRAPAPIVTESGVVSGKTFRLEALQPVIVYCFMVTKFGTEAWTPLPVESWGTEHYAAALPGEVLYDEIPAGENNYNRAAVAGPSEILVIAAFDDTRVTIVPNGRLDNSPSTTVTLKKNQCYQVQSHVDTASPRNPQPDLGGSYIYSTKPVGVITGNTRSQVRDSAGGLLSNSFKNMMIEWLTPTEQHGNEFVYIPTWDDLRPTGAPGENPDWKRTGEVVRIYGTAGAVDDLEPTVTEGVVIEGLSGNPIKTFKVDRTKFYEHRVGAPVPHVYKTDRPAQAFMNTTAVIKFNGTSGGGSFVGSSYNGWSTYMVAMTPRQQWTWVAPYYAPIHPPKMNHFLNIVTDMKGKDKIKVGGSAMVINRQIAGTDLWWGSKTLNRGDKGLIEGADTSVKFYAYLYGNMQGFEVYRPGRTKKDGDGAGSAGNRDRRGGGGSDAVVHPSEYEENIGFMYGYPVAASHMVIRPSDSLEIDTASECGMMTVKVRTVNTNPVGLRAISLDSAKNARLVFVDPAPPEPVIGLKKAEVKIRPIDMKKDASGVVVIQDRTGKTWRVPYTYIAEYVNIYPDFVLDFGQVTINTKTTKVITIVNPIPKRLQVDTLHLALGTQSFTILSTKPVISNNPNNRTMLNTGDTLFVTIEVFPTIENKLYEDSLKVKFGCFEIGLPLRAETVQPCLMMDDLDFGVLAPGQEKSLPLRICNRGRGEVTFVDPFLTWLRTEFRVAAADIEELKTARLSFDQCIEIRVTFKVAEFGTYRDVARFWANTRECRDTSVWRAVVSDISGVAGLADAASGYHLDRIEPNPASSSAMIRFSLGKPGPTTVEIYDAQGRLAASLSSEAREAGDHLITWQSDGLPSGIYYCRIVSGAWSTARPILLVR